MNACWVVRQGDVLEQLAALPDDSVHCVVTSPPYWGLRDYGVDGAYGLEPTLGEYLDRMVEVFREVWRVAAGSTALVWLNMRGCVRGGQGVAVITESVAGFTGDRIQVGVASTCIMDSRPRSSGSRPQAQRPHRPARGGSRSHFRLTGGGSAPTLSGQSRTRCRRA